MDEIVRDLSLDLGDSILAGTGPAIVRGNRPKGYMDEPNMYNWRLPSRVSYSELYLYVTEHVGWYISLGADIVEIVREMSTRDHRTP